MLNTVSAKQIQRGYKKIFEQAKSDNKPIVVITNNKPVGAIISIHLLDKLNKNMQLELLEQEAIKEYKKGQTKKISSPQELQDFFKEVRDAAK